MWDAMRNPEQKNTPTGPPVVQHPAAVQYVAMCFFHFHSFITCMRILDWLLVHATAQTLRHSGKTSGSFRLLVISRLQGSSELLTGRRGACSISFAHPRPRSRYSPLHSSTEDVIPVNELCSDATHVAHGKQGAEWSRQRTSCVIEYVGQLAAGPIRHTICSSGASARRAAAKHRR